MQIVLDYVSGKIGGEEFQKVWYSDPEIGKWLDSLIDLKNPPREEWNGAPYSHIRLAIHKHYDGSVLKFIEASDAIDGVRSYRPKWLDILWHFRAIASIVIIAFPEVVPTSGYDEEALFYQKAVGDSIGGVEAYMDKVLAAFPNTMAKTRRIKEAKLSLRKHFPISGKQYPHWCQEPEWPMGESSPMIFVSQKRVGENVIFTFRDSDTGMVRQIEQMN